MMTGTGAGVVSNNQLTITLGANADSYFLRKNLAAPTTSVTFGARISFSTTNVGTNCEVDLAGLNWDSGTCVLPFGFYLVRDGTDVFNLQETNGNATCDNNRNNYVGNHDNVEFDVKLTVLVGNPGSAALFINGTQVYSRATLQTIPSSTVTMRVGAFMVRNIAAPWTITYRDVYAIVD